MIAVSSDHVEEIEQNIVGKINDLNLYNNVKDLLNVLEPVKLCLDAIQNSKATISDAMYTWQKLLNNPNLEHVKPN